jgi:hypothetical protein
MVLARGCCGWARAQVAARARPWVMFAFAALALQLESPTFQRVLDRNSARAMGVPVAGFLFHGSGNHRQGLSYVSQDSDREFSGLLLTVSAVLPKTGQQGA